MYPTDIHSCLEISNKIINTNSNIGNVSGGEAFAKRLGIDGGVMVETAAAAAKSLQSYPTLCDPIDGSPPGSPVPGILQARTLEWVTISFSSA